MNQRQCFALDLVDDAALIAAYERWHAPGAVWPDIVAELRASGVMEMEIWRTGDRLFLLMTVAPDYPRLRDGAPREPEWQALMWQYQKALPHAAPDEKWVAMRRIFALAEQ